MPTWESFAAAEPDFADRVHQRLTSRKHLTMATLRKDGSPRISGTEVRFEGGELLLGMMSGSIKARDLRRDGRIAIHGPTEDPPSDDPSSWSGEAKIAGRARELSDPSRTDVDHSFAVDITEVVLTSVGTPADHLVIESWHPDHGYRRRQRR